MTHDFQFSSIFAKSKDTKPRVVWSVQQEKGGMPLFKMDSWFIPWKGAENAGAELAKMTVLLF